ncbi:hypothetical protein C2S52_014957 [Perilla frutescens var. hirtella]|nr:hypothetical protein C2S52_014957 [Perilla frutescens var. hirtella]
MSSVSSMWCKIQDLHPSITTSIIKLCLVRMYERPSPANKKDVSLECLFHDFEGARIEATIPRNLIHMFKPTLREGMLFGLKKFLVIFNTNKFKIIQHKFKIKFLGQSVLTKMFEESFPMQMYAFKSFGDVQSMENIHEGVLFDVIGLLLTRGEVQITKCSNGREKKLLEFMLQDTEGKRLSCTLWEDYANEFVRLLERHGQPSNIIILQFGHANMYKGQVRVCSSYYVTKILVNANIPKVADFRQRIVIASDMCTTIISSTSQGTTSSLGDDCMLRTIEQLFFDDQIGRFWIVGKVVDVDLEDDDKKDSNDLPAEIHNALMEKKFLFKVDIKAAHNSEYKGAYSVCKVTTDLTYINTFNTSHFDSQESNCYSKLESSNHALDKIEDDFPIETPSSKLDEELELVDEGNVKRSLEDAFSSTIPTKKSKAIIKQEKE